VDPVPDPLLRKSDSADICSQELCPLDHRDGPDKNALKEISVRVLKYIDLLVEV
jgi:hypothetical protein